MDARHRASAGATRTILAATLALGGLFLQAGQPDTARGASGTHLAFSTQPAGGVDFGTVLPVQPVVQVLDAGNAVVTSGADASAPVTLSIAPASPLTGGPGTLRGCTSAVTARSGVATFAACRIGSKAGVGYRLRATASLSGVVATVDSDAFDIGPIGTQLVFSTQPIGGIDHGSPLAVQPIVQVLDAGGRLVTLGADATAKIKLTLLRAPIAGPGTPTLSCLSTSVRAVAGVTSYSGCTVNTVAGLGYRLHATATLLGGVRSVDSAPFDVGSNIPPTQLVFSARPSGGTVGVPFATQPVLQLLDSDAQPQPDLLDNSTVVTLGLGANPGGGTLTCAGGLTRMVVRGAAAFAGCAIDRPGTGYTLVATGASLTGTSAPFTVTP
jgi:trimeric autotransporter adhesin